MEHQNGKWSNCIETSLKCHTKPMEICPWMGIRERQGWIMKSGDTTCLFACFSSKHSLFPCPVFFPFSPYIASVQSSFDNPTDVSYKTSILFKCLYIFFLFFVCVFMWKNPIQALLLGMLLQILVVCFHRCVCDDKIVCRFFERISAPLHHSHLQILTALRELPCSFWEIRFCPQTNTLLSRTEQFLCTLPFVSQSLITWNAALQLVYEKKMNCLHNIWHLNAAEGCIS